MASLDRDQAQVLLLEMQPPIVVSSQTVPPEVLRRAAGAVMRMGEALGLPILASVVPLGPTPPELIADLAPLPPAARSTITPFGDGSQRARLADAGRRVLAVGGVSSEIAVVNTVLDALREGYQVQVLLDCCGGLSERTEAAAIRCMERAGAIPSNVSSFFTGMIDDMATPEAGAVMAALAELWGWNVPQEASS